MDPAEPDPTFDISFEHELDYLRAEITGERDSYEVTVAYWRRIGEELARTGHKKVLVIEMLKENIEIIDAVRAIHERDASIFAGVKIAFFDMKKDHSPTNSYGAAAAAKLGYRVEVFSDIYKAKEWLLAD